MKSLLKYIILTILGVVLCIDLGIERHAVDTACSDTCATTEAEVKTTDYTQPLSELCHPRTFHLEILQRVPSNTRRADTENKHNVTYLKAGKVIHSGISYYIYNSLKLRNSVLSEPSHRLIYLGKLII